MNWLLTIVFYFFLFFQYYISGDFMLSVFKYEKTFGKVLISGFLTTFLITFLVGFPCQLLFTSFKIYFIIQCIAFILFDAVLLFKYKDKIKSYINNKQYKNIDIKTFLKENWLCILFVVLFTSFSMANQLPIYQMNYDDMYYIGKVENLKTAEHLLDTNFFNGKLLSENSINVARVINTYELSYAYFSTIFHIPSTFFCRVSMVIHNYFFFCIVCKEIAKNILDKYFAQYSILPFFIFLIPFGFLQSGLPLWLRVNCYDLWQFQTAMFYGGSIVRTMSIPILYIFSEPLLYRMDFKKIIYLFLISVSFISFSTIYIQILILFFVVMLFIKFSLLLIRNIKKKNIIRTVLYSLCLIFYIVLLISTKYLDHFSFIKTDSFIYAYESFTPYLTVWYDHDIILNFGIIIILLGVCITSKWENKIVYLITLGLFLFIYNGYFIEFLVVTAFNFFFVILRTIASIQFFILFLCGCTFISLLKKVKFKKIFLNIFSILSISFVLTVFYFGQNTFLSYVYLGSGISENGWNFHRLLNFNTNMTAEIFENVGKYFNELTNDTYKLFSPAVFYTDLLKTYDYGFMLSSSKIQIQDRGGIDVLNADELLYLNDFSLYGQGELSVVKSLIEKEDISYILLFDETSKSYFEENQVVLQNTENKNPWFLIKIN